MKILFLLFIFRQLLFLFEIIYTPQFFLIIRTIFIFTCTLTLLLITSRKNLWLIINYRSLIKQQLFELRNLVQSCELMSKLEEKKLGAQIGQKRIAPSSDNTMLDARSLIGRFRSKKDLYDYLLYQRKKNDIRLTCLLGQFYLPPRRKINKDFLKDVFSGKKSLISQDQIRPVNVPKYDELSVVNLIKEVMQNEQLAKFFPEQRTAADLPERAFFFNVINTTEPDYLQALMKHSNGLRFESKDPEQNRDVIEVSEFWQRELQASPYFSRSPGKTLHLLKKVSKRARSGFKRKKLAVLGTFQEIKSGAKKAGPIPTGAPDTRDSQMRTV